MFKKILIANRGEVAVRIMRACQELGITTVAVYSDIDQDARHVRIADEAYLIGPAPVGKSYLNSENIIKAAEQSNADAIHPGYGLLSENADFAQLVRDSGRIFIGPSTDAIRLMGDKTQAREQVQEANVPILPGFSEPHAKPSTFQAAAKKIGFPVMIKAAAGGGGKGMRIAKNAEELLDSISAAKREALHAFGDGQVMLEKYIPNAHHIEIQILGDEFGNLLHLFERECSVQRRHQKIIEETPSPLMTDELRYRMGVSAIKTAQSVKYSNAGTVEFIVDPRTKEYFFLEMNTRLQVEHPITEMVTGIDIVQWQIRIANQEQLTFNQADIRQRGHAIECRVYAEDPQRSFLPASGSVLRFSKPEGPGIRVDSGISMIDNISVHYDPLIAKVIAHGQDRQSTIQKMKRALGETVLLGLTSNIFFLSDVLDNPDFVRGRVDTTWVERNYGDYLHPHCDLETEVLIAAAMSEYISQPVIEREIEPGDPYSPWKTGNFRIGNRGDQ